MAAQKESLLEVKDMASETAGKAFSSQPDWSFSEQLYDETWFRAGQTDILGNPGEFRGLFDLADAKDRADPISSFTNPNDELFSLLALASVALGVRGRSDFILPFICHAVWWATGNKGVDAIYSVMAGQQTARRQYRTAALPALKDIVDFFAKSVSFERRWMKTIFYFVGFFVTYFKVL